jgi:hypothetical protein
MREATLEDVVALWHSTKRAAFPYVAAQQQYTLEDDRRQFETVVSREAHVWLAVVELRLAGFVALRAELIDLLFVSGAFERSGVSTALLHKARQLHPDRLRAFTFRRKCSNPSLL